MSKTTGFIKAVLLSAGFAVAAPSAAQAIQITSPSTPVTGYGVYYHNAGLIVDGNLASEGSKWSNAPSVYWYNKDNTYFILDLQQVYTIEDALIQVDNNDYYKAYYSLDNSTWAELFYISRYYGEICWGMDTMSTVSGNPEYVYGIDFSPVNARYIKFRATAGDRMYSISELKLYGELVQVPEPSTALLLGGGILGAALFRRKLMKK